MDRLIHCAVFMMLLAPWWVAAEAPDQPQLEPPAAIARYTPQGCRHAGRYAQELIADGFDQPLRSSGAFVFDCEQGLIWATTNPYLEVWVYPREGKPKQRDEQGVYRQVDSRVHQQLGQLLNRLIGGDAAYLTKYFSISALEQGLRLLPVKKRMSQFITSIELLADNDNKVITLQQPQQNMVITIFDDEPYAALNDNLCVQKLDRLSAACEQLVN